MSTPTTTNSNSAQTTTTNPNNTSLSAILLAIFLFILPLGIASISLWSLKPLATYFSLLTATFLPLVLAVIYEKEHGRLWHPAGVFLQVIDWYVMITWLVVLLYLKTDLVEVNIFVVFIIWAATMTIAGVLFWSFVRDGFVEQVQSCASAVCCAFFQACQVCLGGCQVCLGGCQVCLGACQECLGQWGRLRGAPDLPVFVIGTPPGSDTTSMPPCYSSLCTTDHPTPYRWNPYKSDLDQDSKV